MESDPPDKTTADDPPPPAGSAVPPPAEPGLAETGEAQPDTTQEGPAMAQTDDMTETQGSDGGTGSAEEESSRGSGSENSSSTATSDSQAESPLDVSDLNLSKDDLIRLSLGLYDDAVVTTLNVSGNAFVTPPTDLNLERAQARRLLPFVKEPKEYETVDWELVETFCKSLKANKTLRSLSMARTSLGLKGQRALVLIGQTLKDRNRLCNFYHLDLSGVHMLGESRMRYNGLVSLCGFLQSSRTIRSLVLRDNWLHTEAAKFIANALIDNTSMTSLDLACNRIGLDPEGRPCSSGLAAFSTWFRQKCRLTSLNLSSNHLGNEEALGFGQDLAFLNTLQTLDLHDNNVKVTGCESIARALPANESLTCLDLSRNKFFDQGAITLFQAVAKNRSLLTLRLEGNSLSPFAVGAFEHSLRQNHVLQHLHLDNNALQPSDLAALDLHVAVNRDLLAITADPMLYNVEIRSAEFQEQLLRKLHHLRKEDHHRLRDFNRSMRMDRRFHELLVTLVPYTRKEMLHMLELKKVRRQHVITHKLHAMKAFLGNRLISFKRAEEERRKEEGMEFDDEFDESDNEGTSSSAARSRPTTQQGNNAPPPFAEEDIAAADEAALEKDGSNEQPADPAEAPAVESQPEADEVEESPERGKEVDEGRLVEQVLGSDETVASSLGAKSDDGGGSIEHTIISALTE